MGEEHNKEMVNLEKRLKQTLTADLRESIQSIQEGLRNDVQVIGTSLKNSVRDKMRASMQEFLQAIQSTPDMRQKKREYPGDNKMLLQDPITPDQISARFSQTRPLSPSKPQQYGTQEP